MTRVLPNTSTPFADLTQSDSRVRTTMSAPEMGEDPKAQQGGLCYSGGDEFSGRTSSATAMSSETLPRRTRSFVHGSLCTHCARVAELADALDLGSRGATRGGSTPPSRTRSGSRNEG